MEGNIYYAVLGAFVIMTLLSLKHDKWMIAFIFVILGAWVYYTHETGVTYEDLKQDLGKAVDESAKKEFKEKIEHDYPKAIDNTNNNKNNSSSAKKIYETDPRYKVGE